MKTLQTKEKLEKIDKLACQIQTVIETIPPDQQEYLEMEHLVYCAKQITPELEMCMRLMGEQ